MLTYLKRWKLCRNQSVLADSTSRWGLNLSCHMKGRSCFPLFNLCAVMLCFYIHSNTRATGITSHTIMYTVLAAYRGNPPSLYLPAPCYGHAASAYQEAGHSIWRSKRHTRRELARSLLCNYLHCQGTANARFPDDVHVLWAGRIGKQVTALLQQT